MTTRARAFNGSSLAGEYLTVGMIALGIVLALLI